MIAVLSWFEKKYLRSAEKADVFFSNSEDNQSICIHTFMFNCQLLFPN